MPIRSTPFRHPSLRSTTYPYNKRQNPDPARPCGRNRNGIPLRCIRVRYVDFYSRFRARNCSTTSFRTDHRPSSSRKNVPGANLKACTLSAPLLWRTTYSHPSAPRSTLEMTWWNPCVTAFRFPHFGRRLPRLPTAIRFPRVNRPVSGSRPPTAIPPFSDRPSVCRTAPARP